MVEYRAYFFTNCYLSSIQHGIQAAHCLQRMNLKYYSDREESKKLFNWANNDQVIIVLNGGNNKELHEINEKLHMPAVRGQLPIADFHEDKNSLNGLLTCVGIIVPNFIYDAEVKKGQYYETIEFKSTSDYNYHLLTEDEVEIYRTIKSKRLAQ